MHRTYWAYWTWRAQGEVTMQSRTEPDQAFWVPIQRAKRRLPAVLLSVALHLSVLALVVLLGRAARTRLIEPTHFQRLAMLEVAGGSHKVRFRCPRWISQRISARPTRTRKRARRRFCLL